MSSVAYILDDKILEFHRYQGNRCINFWRLSLQGFERFDVGDFMFFVDKRKNHPVTQEKGIIGFGRATAIRAMSPQFLWNTYETENGFPSKEQFYEALVNAASIHKIPNQIQSIYLEDVTYFKDAVYLSEISSDLVQKLDNGIYLEDKGIDLSLRVIEKGIEIGLDPWVELTNPSEKPLITIIDEAKVGEVLNSIKIQWTQTQEKTIKAYDGSYRAGMFVYKVEENRLKVCAPISNFKAQYIEMLGIRAYIAARIDYLNLQFVIVSRSTVGKDSEEIIDLTNLELEYI